MAEETKPVRRKTRGRDILIGAITAVCGVVLLGFPIVVGPSMGRFFVVAGFLAICGGIGIVLNALLEKRKT